MSLINREDLLQTLGITDMDCEKCGWYSRTARRCKRGSDFEDACFAIENAPTIERTGKWIDYSEDGYVECPFCHSATNCDDNIDELHFCFSCGAKMDGRRTDGTE